MEKKKKRKEKRKCKNETNARSLERRKRDQYVTERKKDAEKKRQNATSSMGRPMNPRS
jgi:hypothetical protein